MAKFSKIIRHNSENLLINNFIKIFKHALYKKIKKSKRFSFVLTGGDSPIKLYKKIAKLKKIPWDRIDFFIGDERYVNENSKYSNFNMCRKYLFKVLKIPSCQIFKISTNGKNIKNDVLKYEKILIRYFNNKKINFDFMLLGIGFDGHIASLFKDNINSKSKKIVTPVKRKDFSRISLTLNSINSSSLILLWAPGKKKYKIIKKILSDKKKKYPVSFLRKKNNLLFYSN